MLEVKHLLESTSFPPLHRGELTTLQVNVGYRCNQSCNHCHVDAGPKRSEMMSAETASDVIDFLRRSRVNTLDITGGAPELNPNFRSLVEGARALDIHVIDRCNLTILEEPGHEDLADFLTANRVEVIASMPCYLEENVDSQRGKGVYTKSIAGLRRLNELGYGREGSELQLNLVYNPVGAYLPPAQEGLEADYKRELRQRFDVEFNNLFTITNMPIARFGSMLRSKGEFDGYMQLLRDSFDESNLAGVMCRHLISVDWKGYLYDCDFNQMLALPSSISENGKTHISQLSLQQLDGAAIEVMEHCYGCTAGQGSSCGGALN